MLHSLFQFGLPHFDPTLALAFFQSSGQAFFQTLWSSNYSAVSGWFGSGGAITVAADGILSVFLILGVYETFGRGGSYSELFSLMAKVAMCAFLIQSWNTFFSDITTNGAFALANSISNQDFYSNLKDNLQNLIKNNFSDLSPWSLFTDVTLLVNAFAVLLASIIYWIAYYLLSFVFTVWGLSLYAIGPLLVAFIPSSFAGNFGLGYFKGLVQWLSWPILYAVMGQIISGLASQSGWDYTTGVNILTTSAIIIVFSVALIFIPWIAHFIIAGDFARSIGGPVMNQIMSSLSGTGSSVQNAVQGMSGGGGGNSASGSSQSGPPSPTGGGSPSVAPPPPTPPASPAGTINGVPIAVGEAPVAAAPAAAAAVVV
jgi:hypothetical protein